MNIFLKRHSKLISCCFGILGLMALIGAEAVASTAQPHDSRRIVPVERDTEPKPTAEDIVSNMECTTKFVGPRSTPRGMTHPRFVVECDQPADNEETAQNAASGS